MLFNGESRPGIIDYARRRLDEGADTVTLVQQLMNRWPIEVSDLAIANSVVVFARQALRK